jgi:hypothetical protein
MKIDQLMTRPTARGHEARAGLEAFGALLCKSWGLPPVKIAWGPVATACITQRGTITLADLADDATVTRTEVARYAGFLLHELLHRRFTDFGVNDSRPYVARLHNAIEDAWIEARCIREGLTGNARGLLHQLLRGLLADIPAGLDWANPAQYPFSLAVYLRQYGVTVPVPGGLLPAYREALRRLDACQSSTDTLALAQWVYDQMQGGNQQPDQNPDQGDQQGDDQQPGQDQGDGEPGQDGGQDDGQGDGQPGQDDGQEGAEGDAGSAQDGQADDGQADTPDDAGKARKPKDKTPSMEVEPSCPKGKGATAGTYTAESEELGWMGRGSPRALNIQIPGGLRYQVRRLFQNSAQDWIEPGYRSGRLNPGALHRVPTGGEDVFTRRFERDGIDSAAVLVLDLSGSMEDELGASRKLDVALACTWALTETLMQAGVDVAILGFDSSVYRVREFGSTPALKTRATLERVTCNGSTNDWAAIRLAHDLLHRHHAARKVAFVLGDGDGKPVWAQQQVKAGNALGITTIGVGIGHDVRHVYGAGSVRVDRPGDLGTVAFKQMKAAA